MEPHKYSRNENIDTISGVLIIYMIIGHALLWSGIRYSGYYMFFKRFLFFFMAFFFYKSGLFYKSSSFSIIVRDKARRLLIPFVTYGVVGELIRWIRLYVQEGDTNIIHYIVYPLLSIIGRGGPSGNVPLWYLLALFVVSIVVSLCEEINISKRILFLIAFLISWSRSLNVFYFVPPLVLEVSNGILFFILGGAEFNKGSNMKYLILFLVYFMVIIFIPSFMDFRTGRSSSGLWIAWFSSSVAGIILITKIFDKFNLCCSVLSYVGRNSLELFCSHWIIFNVICLFLGFEIYEEGQWHGNVFARFPDTKMFWSLTIISVLFLPLLVVSINNLKKRLFISSK